ncbi:unnamed protein product [Ixodes persulcatus]
MSKKAKPRAYCNSYLQYEFTQNGGNPQCVICAGCLRNEAKRDPAKLSRHLSTKHPAYKDRTTEYFAKKQQQLEAMKLGSHKEATTFIKRSGELFLIQARFWFQDPTSSPNKTKATHLLSYRIAKQLKFCTICEDLIVPCIQDVIKTVIGEEHLKKVQQILQIPCSNDTVGRRIREMASDVES